MSIDTTTPDNPSTTEHDDERPDGGNRPATDRTATAADHLWAALHARPGSTAEELSADAGIGRSTAAKILARWVSEGTAIRVPTGGKRSASRFAVPASADANPPDGTDGAAKDASGPHTGAIANTAEGGTAMDDTNADRSDAPDETAPTGDAYAAQCDAEDPAEAVTGATDSTPDPTVLTEDGSDVTADAPSTPAAGVHDDVATETPPIGTANTEEDSAESAEPDDANPAAAAAVRGPRLAPGALHGMVEDYLRDHPDGEFGPTKIGHELGRSTGAVGNALERLVTAGYAVRTNDRPKRYALATAATAEPNTAADDGA
jgi:predicted transcriptional regulator